MKAKIHVTLKPGILDPQGKTIQHALDALGFEGIQEVRVGKFMEINLAGVPRPRAEEIVAEACQKLLANPVMENFSFTIEGDSQERI